MAHNCNFTYVQQVDMHKTLRFGTNNAHRFAAHIMQFTLDMQLQCVTDFAKNLRNTAATFLFK